MEQIHIGYSIDNSSSSQPTMPTEWTAFRSASLPSVGAAWADQDAPAELSLLPQTLKIPPKLAQIIRWSLRTPLAPAPPDSAYLEREQLERALDVRRPQCSEDRAETSSIISDTRSRSFSSLDRALPKLRGMRHDLVVTAVTKITAMKEKHDRDGATSRTLKKATTTTEKPKTAECTSCFDDLPIARLVNLPCTHNYCKQCLSTLILTALQNESAFPPKCCLSEIPAKTIITALDKKQQLLYKEKNAEYSIPANRRWSGHPLALLTVLY